jgi:hypothetical protein
VEREICEAGSVMLRKGRAEKGGLTQEVVTTRELGQRESMSFHWWAKVREESTALEAFRMRKENRALSTCFSNEKLTQ